MRAIVTLKFINDNKEPTIIDNVSEMTVSENIDALTYEAVLKVMPDLKRMLIMHCRFHTDIANYEAGKSLEYNFPIKNIQEYSELKTQTRKEI